MRPNERLVKGGIKQVVKSKRVKSKLKQKTRGRRQKIRAKLQSSQKKDKLCVEFQSTARITRDGRRTEGKQEQPPYATEQSATRQQQLCWSVGVETECTRPKTRIKKKGGGFFSGKLTGRKKTERKFE